MSKKMLLAFVWPYLYRLAAKKVAGFLQTRRDRRLHGEPEPAASDCPPCPPCPEGDNKSAAPKIWYTLAGVVLGGVFSAVAFLIKDQVQPSI